MVVLVFLGGRQMGDFAKGTTVPTEKSRAEVETILRRYGAKAFSYTSAEAGVQIEFITGNGDRRVRFRLMFPTEADPKYRGKTTPAPGGRISLAEAETRRLWRALVLSIKAKLESVSSKIATFDSEFLANIVDPSTGKTVAEVIEPMLALSYAGKPQALALGLEPKGGPA